jgi:hypothetical protein
MMVAVSPSATPQNTVVFKTGIVPTGAHINGTVLIDTTFLVAIFLTALKGSKWAVTGRALPLALMASTSL